MTRKMVSKRIWQKSIDKKEILIAIGKILEQQQQQQKNWKIFDMEISVSIFFYQVGSKEGREKAKTDPVSKWLTLVLNQIFPG